VPLADVASPNNLTPRAGNVFTTSAESGDIQIGFAGQGGRGTLKAGALEQSNVDVSTELTTMIESQTVYTANSKVFMTGNELLETLMNLKR
jgi:flagellar hook protein FlgE